MKNVLGGFDAIWSSNHFAIMIWPVYKYNQHNNRGRRPKPCQRGIDSGNVELYINYCTLWIFLGTLTHQWPMTRQLIRLNHLSSNTSKVASQTKSCPWVCTAGRPPATLHRINHLALAELVRKRPCKCGHDLNSALPRAGGQWIVTIHWWNPLEGFGRGIYGYT